MDKQTTPTVEKRGAKPIGEAAMTPAERQRRRREKVRVSQERGFLVQLQGRHLQCVDALAKSNGVAVADVLHPIFTTALDRLEQVWLYTQLMSLNGASEAECQKYLRDNLWPNLSQPLLEVDATR